ncbi:hypothetical protein [Peribacillus frigoritolerans]|uniref:hypothetical protein n=1 Tax=Peribacillus frigoritolerans TaxID=450367 RepID=UPI0034196550
MYVENGYILEKIAVDFRNLLPFRRLSAKPPRRKACGVSASQLFGRSVANFFNPIRITGKGMKDKLILNILRDETNSQFFFEKIAVDFRNPLPFRRLSAKPHQSKRLRGLG